MGVEIGRTYQGLILRNGIKTLGPNEAVEIIIEIPDEGEEGTALIFLTEKSMPIARQQLRICGFDPDAMDLQLLMENPRLLAGKPIPVEIEEYKNRAQWRIPTSSAPNKKRVSVLAQQLRAAKKDGEDPIAAVNAAAGEASADDMPF